MSNWAEKQLDEILHNTLQPNDTFEFFCKMCGNCCRKRDEPIMLENSVSTHRPLEPMSPTKQETMQ